MSKALRGLFFPLTSLKLNEVLKTGETFLDAKVHSSKGRYSGSFRKTGKEVKLTLEKIDSHDFWEQFLEHYFFRASGKKYNSARKLFARLGLSDTPSLPMEYSDQKYKFKFKAQLESGPCELQLFYSPVVGRMVVRRV